MAKIKFRDSRLSKNHLTKLSVVNEILEDYQSQGYRLSLRQLYYQLVTKDLIPNEQKEYAKLSALLKEGRMSGFVDWDIIEDRIRIPYIPYFVDDINDAIDDTISQYRLNLQEGQPVYIEVWCEKDALSSILKQITQKYHINLLVNRGYGSVSSMYDAFTRFSKAILNNQQNVLILYVGDYDPSGQDMIRDISSRMLEFLSYCDYGFQENQFTIKPIALTKEQISQYNPPPNPAKLTDPRAKSFIKDKGNMSWEVDALQPKVLNDILITNIEENIDLNMYNKMLSKQQNDISLIKEKLLSI